MKFSLDRDSFAKVLKRIDSVCANHGTFAILASCLIEARNDAITVTGTDLEIVLRVVEPAKVQEDGVIIINSRRILDAINNLPSGTEVFVTSECSQVLIECGNFRARIPTGDVSEYPRLDAYEITSSLTISADALKKLIDRILFSISRDDSRAEFTGALMTISQNGTIQMVSTDGHRLSRAEDRINIKGELPNALEAGVIVPRKGLGEISKTLLDGDCTIDISGGKLIVSNESSIFCINLLTGRFPDFSKVIPANLDHRAVVKRDSFQQILRRASVFTAKVGTIRLSLSMGRLEISTNDVKMEANKVGDMRDFVDAEYEGPGVVAGFNWRYIDEILSVIDGDIVSIEIIDMDSPAVLRDVNSDKMDFIVMPMQL